MEETSEKPSQDELELPPNPESEAVETTTTVQLEEIAVTEPEIQSTPPEADVLPPNAEIKLSVPDPFPVPEPEATLTIGYLKPGDNEPNYPDFKSSKLGKRRGSSSESFKHFEIDGEDEDDGMGLGDESDNDDKLDEVDDRLVKEDLLDKKEAEDRKKKRRARSRVKPIDNTGLKLCFSSLPFTMKEDEFYEMIGPLPEYNYTYWDNFIPENGRVGTTTSFINFVNKDDAWDMLRKFQNFKGRDCKGQEFYIRVTIALFQEIPGPIQEDGEGAGEPNPFLPGSIDEIDFFKEFIERFEQLNGIQGIPYNEDNAITVEVMLKEIEENVEQRKNKVQDTPLTEFIKDTKAGEKKRLQKAREEAEAKELERIRQLKKERKKKKEQRERERRERKDRERRERREKERAQKNKDTEKSREKSKDKDKSSSSSRHVVSDKKDDANAEKTSEATGTGNSKKESTTTKTPNTKKENPGTSKTLVFTNSKAKEPKERWGKSKSPREWGGRRYDDYEYSSSRNKDNRAGKYDDGANAQEKPERVNRSGTSKYEEGGNAKEKPERVYRGGTSKFEDGGNANEKPDKFFRGGTSKYDDGANAKEKTTERVNRRSLFQPGSSKKVPVEKGKPSFSNDPKAKDDSEKSTSRHDKTNKEQGSSTAKESTVTSTKTEKAPSVEKEPKKKIIKKIIKVKKTQLGDPDTLREQIELEGGKVAKVISKPSTSKTKLEKNEEQSQSKSNIQNPESSVSETKSKERDEADKRKSRNRPDIQIYRPGRLRRQDNNNGNGAKDEEKESLKQSHKSGSDS